jgi:hypothetical protein
VFGIISDIIWLALLLSAALAAGYWSRNTTGRIGGWVAWYASACLSVARWALGWIGWTWQAGAEQWRKWRGRP